MREYPYLLFFLTYLSKKKIGNLFVLASLSSYISYTSCFFVFFPGLSVLALLNFFLFNYLTRLDPRFYYRTPNSNTLPRVPLYICLFLLACALLHQGWLQPFHVCFVSSAVVRIDIFFCSILFSPEQYFDHLSILISS